MFRTVLVAFLFFLTQECLADLQCTRKGGECLDWRWYKCTAGYETGLCDGDSNIRCCLPCDTACAITENSYDDDDCESSLDGTCQHNSNYCSGVYYSGYCGGPGERQCCSTNGGGGNGGGGIIGGGTGCTLESYSSLYIKGYNGLDVRVHKDFLGDMDTMNGYAFTCGVTVWVTHAFRYEGQSIGGAIVPPATTSNHLVGHAIDFNVDTPNGWCNGDCLYAGQNSYAECFIQKVVNNQGLTWGGYWSPSDPVHIDDRLNYNNYAEWEALYYQLQGNC